MFSKIDLRLEYHHLCGIEQNIPKNAFKTRYRHYKFIVMNFRLTNTLTMFMNLMNKVFHDCFSKCEFWLDRVTFLGHMISTDGISINLSKMEFVLERQKPKIVKKLKSFLRLVGYYKRLVEGFAKLA